MPQRTTVVGPELDGHRRPGDGEIAVPSGHLLDGNPHRPDQTGTRTPVSSSPSSMKSILYSPVKKSAASTVRAPVGRAGRRWRRAPAPPPDTRRRGPRGPAIPDRPPVADLEVADQRGRPGQQRCRAGDLGARLDRRFGGRRADANRSVLPLDPPELVEAADVDEVLRTSRAVTTASARGSGRRRGTWPRRRARLQLLRRPRPRAVGGSRTWTASPCDCASRLWH